MNFRLIIDSLDFTDSLLEFSLYFSIFTATNFDKFDLKNITDPSFATNFKYKLRQCASGTRKTRNNIWRNFVETSLYTSEKLCITLAILIFLHMNDETGRILHDFSNFK